MIETIKEQKNKEGQPGVESLEMLWVWNWAGRLSESWDFQASCDDSSSEFLHNEYNKYSDVYIMTAM